MSLRRSGRQREQCQARYRFRDRPLRASLARELRPGQVRVPEPAPPKDEHHSEKVLRRKFHRIKARAARSGEGSFVKGPLREAVLGEPWARTHGSDCCGRSPGSHQVCSTRVSGCCLLCKTASAKSTPTHHKQTRNTGDSDGSDSGVIRPGWAGGAGGPWASPRWTGFVFRFQIASMYLSI